MLSTRAALATFLLFLLKGVAWLVVPALAYLWAQ